MAFHVYNSTNGTRVHVWAPAVQHEAEQEFLDGYALAKAGTSLDEMPGPLSPSFLEGFEAFWDEVEADTE